MRHSLDRYGVTNPGIVQVTRSEHEADTARPLRPSLEDFTEHRVITFQYLGAQQSLVPPANFRRDFRSADPAQQTTGKL